MDKGETFTADQVREMLHQACEMSGGQSKWARANGLSPAFVCDVLFGRRLPGPTMTAALGIVEMPRTWRLDDVRRMA